MVQLFKSLIVVSGLSVIAFWISSYLFHKSLPRYQITTWLLTWLSLSAIGFLTANFWIYAVIGSVIICTSTYFQNVKPALFLLLLPLFPILEVEIPGFGILNNIIQLNHARILIICIFLILFVQHIAKRTEKLKGYYLPGIFLTLYVALLICLEFRDSSITNVMRVIIIYSLDIVLPFYMFSNFIRTPNDIIVCMIAFVTAMFAHSLMAIFETAKFWKLFIELQQSWLTIPIVDPYLTRDGLLRAATSADSPIVLGFMIMVSIGLLYGLRYRASESKLHWPAFFILFAGLVSSLSRGPWVGTAVMLLIFLLLMRKSVLYKISKLAACSLLLIPFLMTGFGKKVMSFLPFIGTVETGNIDYRGSLFENAIIVIMRNPIFGSTDYMSTPEMERLRQGQGIIDIVNSYIGVTLETGFVGLFLFVSVFIVTIISIYKATNRLPECHQELRLIGHAQIGILLAIMITIATVSSIGFVPYLYWSLLGLGVSYVRISSNYSKQRIFSNSHQFSRKPYPMAG